jgi:anti-sigma regulatory factor (Ser/Thr protein kinase)
VDVEVVTVDGDIVVTITDQGGAPEQAGPGDGRAPAEPSPGAGRETDEPDIARKLAGEQAPRGWGLFLIRHMVDAMDVSTEGTRHTVRLVMRAGAAARERGPREDHV